MYKLFTSKSDRVNTITVVNTARKKVKNMDEATFIFLLYVLNFDDANAVIINIVPYTRIVNKLKP
ncbi:hypothetical protein BC2926_54830 [Bacillus cereus]|nr:hypothetical protein BC2926_54830 [Bacillus cereus]